MDTLYLVDSGFFILPILMEIFFAIITLLISYLSFKVYSITRANQPRSMSIAFFMIFISYFVQAAINFINFTKINPEFFVFLGIHPLSVFYNKGLYFHMLLLTIGLAFLMYTVIKAKEPTLLLYFIFSSLLVIFLAYNTLTAFFMLTSLYLAFLSYHYYNNYRKKKKTAPLIVAAGFFLLFLGHIGFSFMSRTTLFYIIGHTLDFFGYLMLLINYYMITK